MIVLSQVAEDAKSITLGWTAVSGARSYRLTAEKQARATFAGPNATQAKFAKGSAWYKVEALDLLDEGVYPQLSPPPGADPIWNADLSTGDRSQYGDWEYGGTMDGTPPLSERVAVAQSLDNYSAITPGGYLMRIKVAPGDVYGSTSGWRTICRMPPERTNGGNIVLRSAGYDSSYTWAVLVPPGYPFDSNEWLTGPEWHHTLSAPNVAPSHFIVFANEMKLDVAGVVNGARYEYVNQRFLSGYEKGKWYVFTCRYKHALYPNGYVELWGGKKGADTQMQQILAASNIATIYPNDSNYMLFGSYRAQSGSAVTTSYWGGYREYATLTDALAWANALLLS